MNKTRLLLVDDERNILDGLQRLLRPLRHEWNVRAASSARDALAMLDTEPADVIISDMRMPEMDGATFLGIVKRRAPGTVRLVLTGQTDHDATMRAIPVAHQFLSKPCDPVELLDTLGRVRHVLQALGDERVGKAIGGGLGNLPAAPDVWMRLTTVLQDEDVSVADIGKVVAADPAIAAKLLQLTNSPFFGLRRTISSVVEAVTYLGISQVKSLVLVLGADEGLPVQSTYFDAHAFQLHSMRTGQLARYIAVGRHQEDDCFAAGLLHDIGKLILASALPARYDAIVSAAATSGRAFDEEEAATDDCAPHPALGAYLLNLWGLPWHVVEAVANHEHVPQTEASALGTAGAVYIAHQLLAEAMADGPGKLDRAFVDRVGLGERIPEWRTRAAEMVCS
jgi:HD-like signal output (HDOD) protein